MNLPRSQRSTSSPSPSKKLGGRKSGSASSSRAETGTRKLSVKAAAPHLSAEQVALRAYFIGERRRSLGIHGDETSDWIAAETQLLAELKAK
jgi:hypothetical protein